jgi:hypothetical protein
MVPTQVESSSPGVWTSSDDGDSGVEDGHGPTNPRAGDTDSVRDENNPTISAAAPDGNHNHGTTCTSCQGTTPCTCSLPIAPEEVAYTSDDPDANNSDALLLQAEMMKLSASTAIEKVEIDASAFFDLEDSDSNKNHGQKQASDGAESKRRQRRILVVLMVALMIMIGTAIIVAVVIITANNSSSDSTSTIPTTDPDRDQTKTTMQPMLQTIQERGILRCKPESLEGEKGVGFTIDLVRCIISSKLVNIAGANLLTYIIFGVLRKCRAIAAAIFNDTSRVSMTYVPFQEHFGAIARGELDVSTSHVSLNMGRDVFEVRSFVRRRAAAKLILELLLQSFVVDSCFTVSQKNLCYWCFHPSHPSYHLMDNQEHSRSGFSYSIPYFYTGTALAGVPTFVDCAQNADTFFDDCRHL